MKCRLVIFNVFLVSLFFLTSCRDKNRHNPTPPEPTVKSNGYCSSSYLADYNDLESKRQKILNSRGQPVENVTTLANDYVDACHSYYNKYTTSFNCRMDDVMKIKDQASPDDHKASCSSVESYLERTHTKRATEPDKSPAEESSPKEESASATT